MMQLMNTAPVGILWLSKLRAWREYRELTQEALAEMVGTSGSVISLLEAGKRQLTPKWLNKLGAALHVEPGFILDKDPKDLPVPLLDIWVDIPEARREQALEVLRTFATRARTDVA